MVEPLEQPMQMEHVHHVQVVEQVEPIEHVDYVQLLDHKSQNHLVALRTCHCLAYMLIM